MSCCRSSRKAFVSAGRVVMFCRFGVYRRFSSRLYDFDVLLTSRVGLGGTSVGEYGKAWKTTVSGTIFGYSSVSQGESWSVMASGVAGNYGVGHWFIVCIGSVNIEHGWCLDMHSITYIRILYSLATLHFPIITSNLISADALKSII